MNKAKYSIIDKPKDTESNISEWRTILRNLPDNKAIEMVFTTFKEANSKRTIINNGTKKETFKVHSRLKLIGKEYHLYLWKVNK